jgi:hypothetical protein
VGGVEGVLLAAGGGDGTSEALHLRVGEALSRRQVVTLVVGGQGSHLQLV